MCGGGGDKQPLYISAPPPGTPTVDSLYRYNLRNANNIIMVEARTSLYYQPFLPSVVRDWNSLEEIDRNSASGNNINSLTTSDENS